MSYAWINGQFVEETQASVPLRDAGLLHAAGVFTTMRAWGRRVFRLSQHLARLRRSCQHLYIPLEHSDDDLTHAVDQLLTRNQLSEARLRLTVTRGASAQDPLHGLRMQPNVFLTAAQLEPYPDEFYQRGMTAIVLDEQKANPYDIQAGHKTLNYFSRLAALRAANQIGAGEALWFNVHNYLQSGSISNVFLVKAGALITPPTQPEIETDPALAQRLPYARSNVLPGITRGAVFELARAAGVAVNLSAIPITDLLEADEVFLTNSVMAVMPVCRIERRPIGEDRPGPLTLQLSKSLADTIAAEHG